MRLVLEVMRMPQQEKRRVGTGAKKAGPGPQAGEAAANSVRLRGRVTSGPEERELPSGTRIVTFRISVRRASTVMTRGSRQQADWVDCSAWTVAMRRRTSRWQVGDTVEVEGSLRRRFRGGPGGSGSTVEIEVSGARRVDQASAAGTAQSRSAPSR